MLKNQDFNNPEDEKYFQKGFKENKGFWLIYGGLFQGPLWIPIHFITLISPFAILMVMTVFKSYKTDLVGAIENIHFIIFVTLELFGTLHFIRKRKLIISTYCAIGKDFFDYENTLDEECLETKRSAFEEAAKRKKFIYHSFTSVTLFACITVTIFRPLFRIIYFDPNEGTPDDGFVKVALMTVWTPFDKTQWYSIALVWYCECLISYSTLTIVFGFTFFFVFSLEDLGIQLRLLRKSLTNVIERARRLDMPMEEGIKLCLKYSIRHHQILFKFKDEIQEVVGIVSFGLFGGFSIILCVCGYIFTLNDIAIISKLVFGLFLVAEIVMLFAFCYIGEEIQRLSEEIGDALYESDWTPYSKLMKNYMLIIQLRSRVNMRIDLLGFMDISRNTFSNISSSAYSYLNLMREFN